MLLDRVKPSVYLKGTTVQNSLVILLACLGAMILTSGCERESTGQTITVDMGSGSDSLDHGHPDPDLGPQLDFLVDSAQAQPDAIQTQPDAVQDAQVDSAAPVEAIPAFHSPRTYDLMLSDSLAIQPSLAWGLSHQVAISWCGMTAEDLGIWFGVWSANGEAVVEPFILSTTNAGIQNEPKACALAGGGYVVVWSMDSRMAPTNLQVRYRRIDANGQPLDENDIRIGSDEPGNHWLPQVACDPAGGFTIVGVASEPNNTFGVFAQHFDAMGSPTHDKLIVNTQADGGQVYPAVATDGQGRTLVVWEEQPADMSPAYLQGRWLTSTGETLSDVFVVGQDTVSLTKPLVALDPSGETGVISGLSDNRKAVYYRIEAVATDPSQLVAPAEDISHSVALASAPGQGMALMYFSGVGSGVSVKAGVLSPAYEFSEMTTLNTGAVPPYAPSINVRNGRLAAIWTERFGERSFFLRLALFGPE